MKKMKKSFKKVLAQMLVLAMCLTMLPMAKVSVKAAGEDNAVLIKSSALGSITVTKYATVDKTTVDGDSNAAQTTGNEGTGIETGLPATATGYEPLAGAVFNLYKIADADAVVAYYNGDNEEAYSIDNYSYDSATKVAKYGTTTLTAMATGTTADGTGDYTFENLPVGIYILQEVEANDQITAPLSKPCLVSIPMVNSATSTNKENKEWTYDVKVFPKNHESTGTVEIFKQDQNKNGLNDVTFELYRKNMTDKSGTIDQNADWVKVTAYDVNGQNASVAYDTFTTATKPAEGSNPAIPGYLKIDNIPATLYGAQYKLVEISAPNGYTVNKTPIYFKVLRDNTIVYNTDTAFPNENTAVIDKQVVDRNDLQLTIRNEQISVEKKVLANGKALADAAAEDWKSDEEFRLDDTLTYRVIAYVPYNAKEISFQIEDKLTDGLRFGQFVSIKSGVLDSQNKPNCNLDITNSDKLIKTTSTSGYTINLDNDKINAATDTDVLGRFVEITYTATMTDAAVFAKNGNANDVKITYKKEVGGTTDTYEITDEVRVYTYEYQITKTLDTKEGTPAGNVVFNLYDANDKQLKVIKLGEGNYRLALTETETGATADLVTSTADAATTTDLAKGLLAIKGLENGNYYLREIQTVTGYNLLSEDYKFEIAVNRETQWDTATTTVEYTSGSKKNREYTKTVYNSSEGDTGLTSATIVNKKGFVLPQTGSMGYLLFCVAGILLVFGGAVLMFSGRKKTIR